MLLLLAHHVSQRSFVRNQETFFEKLETFGTPDTENSVVNG